MIGSMVLTLVAPVVVVLLPARVDDADGGMAADEYSRLFHAAQRLNTVLVAQAAWWAVQRLQRIVHARAKVDVSGLVKV